MLGTQKADGREERISAVQVTAMGEKKRFDDLLFVAVEAVEGRDGAEEAVDFIVDTGGEKRSVGWSGASVVAESERPQAVDGHERAIGILHEADELVGEAVERRDPSAAEIADENGVAELAKIARGPYDTPGSVEPVAVLEAADGLAGGRERPYEAKAMTAAGVVAQSVLLGVGNK